MSAVASEPAVALPPGLHVLERGWLSSNMVVLDDGDRITVVDTGYVDHAGQTLALVRHAAAGRPVERIVNTHLHSDHCGGNAALADATGAPILIPPGHAEAVAAWDESVLTFAATGQYCPRFTASGVLRPGEQLRAGGRAWHVLAAPGHDPHMVMLWAPDVGVLMSADALWANGFGVIFPEVEGESGFGEQAAALDVIAAHRPRLVVPGHGAPFSDVDAALGRARSRLQALRASPSRNARHALNVLVKFWLLQVRRTTVSAAVAHFDGTRYLHEVARRYFPAVPRAALVERAIEGLCLSGAAGRSGEAVWNID